MTEYVQVKRFRRGAFWPDGTKRMCTTCGVLGKRRAQALVVALRKNKRTGTKLPVGYCGSHVPEELKGN